MQLASRPQNCNREVSGLEITQSLVDFLPSRGWLSNKRYKKRGSNATASPAKKPAANRICG